VLGAARRNLTHAGYPVTDSPGAHGPFLAWRSRTVHTPRASPFQPDPVAELASWPDMLLAASRSPTAKFPKPRAQGRHEQLQNGLSTSRGHRSARATAATSELQPTMRPFAAFFDRLQKVRHHTGEHGVRSPAPRRTTSSPGQRRPGEPATPVWNATESRSPACHYANVRSGSCRQTSRSALDDDSNNTAFDGEPSGPSIYVHGQPAADDPASGSSNATPRR